MSDHRAEPVFHIEESFLTVGKGWAVVKDVYAGELSPEHDSFLLEHIPQEAELATLVITPRFVPLDIQSWTRCSLSLTRADNARPSVQVDKESVVISPGVMTHSLVAATDVSSVVRCYIAPVAFKTTLRVEVVYVMRAVTWSAHYQIAVRGIQSEENEPVSVDLAGFIRIQNDTEKIFNDADMCLIDDESIQMQHAPKAPGILSLPDTPLMDLWVTSPQEIGVSYDYHLPMPISVPADAQTDVQFVEITRKPAERLYGLRSEDFPLDASYQSLALRKYIVFNNSRMVGLGQPLPAG